MITFSHAALLPLRVHALWWWTSWFRGCLHESNLQLDELGTGSEPLELGALDVL